MDTDLYCECGLRIGTGSIMAGVCGGLCTKALGHVMSECLNLAPRKSFDILALYKSDYYYYHYYMSECFRYVYH